MNGALLVIAALLALAVGRVVLVVGLLLTRIVVWFAAEPEGVGGIVTRAVVAALVLHGVGLL
jgi:hypothetical protein